MTDFQICIRVPLMIALYCLRAKSNMSKRSQFERDVTWFYFCFDFVRLHARYHLERGICFKLDVQDQGGGRISDVDVPGMKSLENWTISVDVKCVLLLIAIV